MLTDEEVHNRYFYHPPTEEAKRLHGIMNEAFEFLALKVEAHLPEGRQKSIVHTKLEEAKMWANASIAQNHDRI